MSKTAKKVRLPKVGQFIVTTPSKYDRVQPTYGVVKEALLTTDNTSVMQHSLQIYWQRPYQDKHNDIDWTFCDGFKVIPKYAIPGFLAMKELAAERNRTLAR